MHKHGTLMIVVPAAVILVVLTAAGPAWSMSFLDPHELAVVRGTGAEHNCSTGSICPDRDDDCIPWHYENNPDCKPNGETDYDIKPDTRKKTEINGEKETTTETIDWCCREQCWHQYYFTGEGWVNSCEPTGPCASYDGGQATSCKVVGE